MITENEDFACSAIHYDQTVTTQTLQLQIFRQEKHNLSSHCLTISP